MGMSCTYQKFGEGEVLRDFETRKEKNKKLGLGTNTGELQVSHEKSQRNLIF